jgi:N-acetylglucosamine-6-sulfatase
VKPFGAALVILLCLLGAQAAAGAPPASRPNVVIILTDDQHVGTLWAMPNVQRYLVQQGVEFQDAFVSNSLCCPSRSTILTGLYSHTTGVYSNRPPFGAAWGFRKSGGERQTLAIWMKRAGYRTALIGKYLNAFHDPPPVGWDVWRSFLGGIGYYNYRLSVAGRVKHAREYSTDYFANQALRFVAASRQPFFLYLAPAAPHEPATPPARYAHSFATLPPYRSPAIGENVSDKPAYIRAHHHVPTQAEINRFRRRQYQALLAVDDLVGRLVRSLAARGELKDTVIVFMSDNGVAWGEHRLAAAEKIVPYESSIRVPLVIRYDPLTHNAARRDRHMVANVDLAPTLAALAGVRHPPLEGLSLVPLLKASSPQRPPRQPWRTKLLLEGFGGLHGNDPQQSFCGVRARDWKYILNSSGEPELYDLKRDPYELQNRSGFSGPWARSHERRGLALVRQLCFPLPPGYAPDELFTHVGADTLVLLTGTAGNDYIRSVNLEDTVEAGAGNDTIYAAPPLAVAAQSDYYLATALGPGGHYYGGEGDDRLETRNGRIDYIDCGPGHDRAIIDTFDVTVGCEQVSRPRLPSP